MTPHNEPLCSPIPFYDSKVQLAGLDVVERLFEQGQHARVM
ncbi:hypothetical protein ACFXNW_28920 [Nocardia sp. NPDC059180]